MSNVQLLKPQKPRLTPDVVARFKAYHEMNLAWGRLHIVLDGDNFHDDHVRHAIEWARQENDGEGLALAELLLRMSWTQRRKLSRIA